jgi:hypothetical protein
MTPLARRFAAMMRNTMAPLDPLTHARALGLVHHSSSSAFSRAIRSAAFAECLRSVSNVLQISAPIPLSVVSGALTGAFFQGQNPSLSIMAPSLFHVSDEKTSLVANRYMNEIPGGFHCIRPSVVTCFIQGFASNLGRLFPEKSLIHSVLLIPYASNPSAWAGACQ